MLLAWARKNLEQLNSETARQYLLEEVIPHCRTICNQELEQHGFEPLAPAEFMKFIRLKTLDVSTAWRWLKQLGFTYSKNEKTYYTDGHEKAENVRYRLKFIKRYFEHELRCFRWVQLTEAQAEALEELEKNPLKKGFGHSYDDDDGQRMRELHVDCHDALLDYISPETALFGGNLSVRFPSGMRPLIIVGQDEMITYQFLFSAKSWKGPMGEALILPKGEGEGIMISAFVLRELGLGPDVTDDQLREINLRFRTGKEYVSKEEAISLFGTASKRPITRAHFDDDLVDSPFLKMFRYGQAHDGYWTHRHMKIQTEDLIDVLKVIFPSYDFLLLFDQSSGHTKKREDGLNVGNMNRDYGGRVPVMRQTLVNADCLGVHSPSLQAGAIQELVYPTSENCEPEDGPCNLSIDERMLRRHDITLPLTTTENKSTVSLKAELAAANIDAPLRPGIRNLRLLATANGIATTRTVDNRVHRDKTIEELKNELASTSFIFEHRTYRLTELQELSTARNITTTITHPKIQEGWCAKPKGIFQILFERGKIDPDVPTRSYKKYGTKATDFEENGDLKESSKPFVLAFLLSQCPDFVNEISDLQHLAAELSDETCTVTIEFTPKYHCEIAGEGIEYCWGFTKKIQRRLPLNDRRKVEGFIKSVKGCLKRLTPVRARRFARRARKYMLAYLQISNSLDGAPAAAASRDQIDAIVNNYYVAP